MIEELKKLTEKTSKEHKALVNSAEQLLSKNMENIEKGRPIEFIRHRRESGGYEKSTETHEGWGGNNYTRTRIQRVDND